MSIIHSVKDNYVLSNGVEVPGIAFGTWRLQPGHETEAIQSAIENGFRHLDTAVTYESEPFVGEAMRRSGVKREDIFVTTKLWNTDHSYERALSGFDDSLKRLGLEYVDLYLIHWPIPGGHKNDYKEMNRDTWKAMEKLYRDGKVRAIGVSNFMPHHLRPILESAEIKPMVNQIELHPHYQQAETVYFSRQNGLLLEACFPLMSGDLFADPLFQYLAKKYDKTPAQIGVRWHVQKGYVPVVKSSNPAHQRNNLDVFDFELSPIDMLTLDAENGKGQCSVALYPDDFPDKLPDHDAEV